MIVLAINYRPECFTFSKKALCQRLIVSFMPDTLGYRVLMTLLKNLRILSLDGVRVSRIVIEK